MAKYTASPHYAVSFEVGDIRFDWQGEYETGDSAEIKALDALCPVWIKKQAEEDAPKTTAAPKAAKPSAK